MSKQDRQGARTVSELDRRYNVKKAMGVANDSLKASSAAQETASTAQETASAAQEAAKKASGSLVELEAKLELKLGVDEKGNVVSTINGVAQVIKFLANCISIQSNNFKLSEDGTVIANLLKATNADIEGKLKSSEVDITGGKLDIVLSNGCHIRIGKDFDVLAFDSSDYSDTSATGTRLALLNNAIQYVDRASGSSVLPIVFGYSAERGYTFRLNGDWVIPSYDAKIAALEEKIAGL